MFVFSACSPILFISGITYSTITSLLSFEDESNALALAAPF